MSHRIYNFDFEDKRIPLVPSASPTYNTENTYTVIVGKNGVGKSRFLAAVAKSMMRTTKVSRDYGDLYIQPGVDLHEYTVIAASTSPFDKFPYSPRPRDYSSLSNYRYIGMRGDNVFSNTSSIALISSAAKGLLETIAYKHSDFRLVEIFETLDFSPNVEFVFKPSFMSFGNQRSIEYTNDPDFNRLRYDLEKLFQETGILVEGKQLELLYRMSEEETRLIFQAMYDFFRMQSKNKAISVFFDFSNNELLFEGHKSDSQITRTLFTLLSAGFIRLMDLRLEKRDFGRMSLKKASSGEQCMLVLMLGIAGHITDNSLVLIDEPEISLHPKWQENFMILLMSAFSKYRGCQFLIATHSPQVIARMTGPNCYVCSLTKEQLYPGEQFLNRSADFQLAELFDAPGMMNEYVSRLAFNLLAKVKASKQLDSDNKNELLRLLKLSKTLDPNDPVKELISSIESVCQHYADN
jgi:predicted ATPase